MNRSARFLKILGIAQSPYRGRNPVAGRDDVFSLHIKPAARSAGPDRAPNGFRAKSTLFFSTAPSGSGQAERRPP